MPVSADQPDPEITTTVEDDAQQTVIAAERDGVQVVIAADHYADADEVEAALDGARKEAEHSAHLKRGGQR